jgi:hypothetical protein
LVEWYEPARPNLSGAGAQGRRARRLHHRERTHSADQQGGKIRLYLSTSRNPLWLLEKGTDYDTKGALTGEFSEGRSKAWTQRAVRAGSEATDRRNRAGDEIANREKLANELQRRNEREEQEQLEKFERSTGIQAAADRAIDGGVDPPSVAAMKYEDEQARLCLQPRARHLHRMHQAMKKVLLILTLMLAGSLQAAKPKSNLTIVDADLFFAASDDYDFWETPAGLAFWDTPEGKTVLKIMADYQYKIESKQQP